MLLSNLPLSTVCALVGIGVPIAFSFALLNAAFGYKPLEAFAAGAALSSTSLGTTLAALNSVTKDSNSVSNRESHSPTTTTKNAIDCSLPTTRSPSPVQRATTSPSLVTEPAATSFQQSRIGTVLISAAIIDDVVGLVIAAVIPALALVQFPTSQSGNSGLAWTIIRPLLSSVLIAAIAPLVARFILRPLFWYRGVGELWCAPARMDKPWGTWPFAKVGSGWGSEKHADVVKLFLMVLAVSAMATISYCRAHTFTCKKYYLMFFISSRYRHEHSVWSVHSGTHPHVYITTSHHFILLRRRGSTHRQRTSPQAAHGRPLLRGRIFPSSQSSARTRPTPALLRQHRFRHREPPEFLPMSACAYMLINYSRSSTSGNQRSSGAGSCTRYSCVLQNLRSGCPSCSMDRSPTTRPYSGSGQGALSLPCAP